ncbi:MAG: hypothetical protein RL722_502 [Pseudomonadota bacterium]|jgi:D-amino-acid dehydrogenase
MRVVVIGGGVIGLTSAWALAERGLEVTLLEAAPALGLGASGDNGAQLSYAYVAPLAQPGLWAELPGLLMGGSRALRVNWPAALARSGWCLRFLAACRAGAARDTTVALLALAQSSRTALQQLLAEEALAIDHRQTGKLVVYRSPASWQAAQRQVQLQRALGCHQAVLDARACADLEPALADRADQLLGGVHTPDEASGDCRRFVEQLGARLAAAGRIRLQLGVGEAWPELSGGRLVAVRTARERHAADAVVLAAGVGSRAFARRAGLALPVLGLKGTSCSLDLPEPEAAPRLSLTDYAHRVVYARVSGRLRVAGFVEIGARDAVPEPAAIRHLQACTAELFPRLAAAATSSIASSSSAWAGLRPATPSGRPLIGASPLPGLWLNTGHGALGWTLACGSARLLVQQMVGAPTEVDPAPFAWR